MWIFPKKEQNFLTEQINKFARTIGISRNISRISLKGNVFPLNHSHSIENIAAIC